ncbi:iron complex transport system permease protein [Novosphingobium hassiacum]|uniref:Iron complex transport system permease protein n=1 Tax=Novosphingobium hassiacum TaxID=173676 RepID=A0A7W5ZUB6_9SPHN|nr:iron ABC transporter permease [Novosphingobium hassiacum]MBB3859587.1 iron complex transport system permease protein [Novosphingobium hassiacum]
MKLNLGLLAAVLVAMLGSLMAGRTWVPFDHWLAGDLQSLIVMELRLPRACVGAIVGASLGMAGAAMQGYLRNPLADPGLFGVSSSAALGAVVSLYFGFAVSAWLLPIFALAGAGLGITALAILAGRSGSLILFTLSGVILSSLTGALTSLLISLAPTPFASSEIVTWLMGALMDRSWDDVRIALPVSVLGMAALLWAARYLDALTLGDAAARSMGVNMTRLQWLIVIGVGLTVGSSVAVAGIIGFVGLVVPHLVRPLVGHRPSALLIPSALAGALLVVLADCLVRILPSASEVRLGIAMASIGTPFFVMLLFRMRREVA